MASTPWAPRPTGAAERGSTAPLCLQLLRTSQACTRYAEMLLDITRQTPLLPQTSSEIKPLLLVGHSRSSHSSCLLQSQRPTGQQGGSLLGNVPLCKAGHTQPHDILAAATHMCLHGDPPVSHQNQHQHSGKQKCVALQPYSRANQYCRAVRRHQPHKMQRLGSTHQRRLAAGICAILLHDNTASQWQLQVQHTPSPAGAAFSHQPQQQTLWLLMSPAQCITQLPCSCRWRSYQSTSCGRLSTPVTYACVYALYVCAHPYACVINLLFHADAQPAVL
jgi:hypothetical protein